MASVSRSGASAYQGLYNRQYTTQWEEVTDKFDKEWLKQRSQWPKIYSESWAGINCH
jgi:hypothetical protein